MDRRSIAAIAACFAAGCAAPAVGVTPQFAFVEVEGRVGVQNDEVDARNALEDLGLDEGEGVPGGRLDLKWGVPHLSLSYLGASFSGEGTATAELSDGGTTIQAGADVASELDIGVTSGILTFDFVPGEDIEAGLGVGALALDLRGRVSELSDGDTVDGGETIPMPVLAARVTLRFDRLEIAALYSGSRVDFEGDQAEYSDVDLHAAWRLLPAGWLQAGWRRMYADVDFDEGGTAVLADLRLQGPYLGLAITF